MFVKMFIKMCHRKLQKLKRLLGLRFLRRCLMFRYNKNKLETTHIYIWRQIKIPKNWVGNSNNKLNKHKLPVFVHFEHIRAKYT